MAVWRAPHSAWRCNHTASDDDPSQARLHIKEQGGGRLWPRPNSRDYKTRPSAWLSAPTLSRATRERAKNLAIIIPVGLIQNLPRSDRLQTRAAHHAPDVGRELAEAIGH